jgi:hypothetical protein
MPKMISLRDFEKQFNFIKNGLARKVFKGELKM